MSKSRKNGGITRLDPTLLSTSKGAVLPGVLPGVTSSKTGILVWYPDYKSVLNEAVDLLKAALFVGFLQRWECRYCGAHIGVGPAQHQKDCLYTKVKEFLHNHRRDIGRKR